MDPFFVCIDKTFYWQPRCWVQRAACMPRLQVAVFGRAHRDASLQPHTKMERL